MTRNLLLYFLALLFVAEVAQADRRKYVWTYQYATIAPEQSEIEFYQTTRVAELDLWEYRIEIEHGLTPKWDLSIYQIFAQKEGEPFKWDAFQIRTRYRLAEPGRYLFDPILYLEYRRKVNLKEQNKLETKLILARNFERVNLALNPVYEFFWAPSEPVHEVGLDIGVSYEVSYRLSLAFESTTRIEYEPSEPNETSSYFGPTLSFTTGGAFYAVGYAWGLTDDSDDARVRFLMGVSL